MNSTIRTFFDLNAWQESKKLTLSIYEKTKIFPREEIFGLTSQMRRASVSVTANIAEGFGRISIKEKLNFYNLAYGSLTELQSHIFIATDLQYLSKEDAQKLLEKIESSQLLLHGLMRSTRKRLQTPNSQLLPSKSLR